MISYSPRVLRTPSVHFHRGFAATFAANNHWDSEAERLQLVAAHHAEQGRKLLAEARSGSGSGGDADLRIPGGDPWPRKCIQSVFHFDTD